MKFSVITINYNNRSGLESTIQSVLRQDYKDYDYIIIDGGSNDGSVEIIDKYKSGIDYAISEKDSGVYDAMNKGIKLAKGDYIVFMNSGDQFFDEFVLSTYSTNIEEKYQIYYGNVEGVDKNGSKDITYPETLNLSQWLFDTINHQASAIKRSLFSEFGLYNTNSRITADWQFFTKMFLVHRVQFKHLNKKLAIIDLNGISSDPSLSELQQKERDDFIRDELPQFWLEYLFIRENRFHKFMNRRGRQMALIKQSKWAYRMLKIWMDFLTLFLGKRMKDS